MARAGHRTVESHGEAGQAALLMLGALAVLLAGVMVLFGFGNALGAKGRHQRAADLAAISGAQVMRDLYPRLFEPPFIESDVVNPRHLEEAEYRALVVSAAIRGAPRNGVHIRAEDVTITGSGFAPTQVTVRARGETRVSLAGGGHGRAGPRGWRLASHGAAPCTCNRRARARRRRRSAGPSERRRL
jgi:hypothetical protein